MPKVRWNGVCNAPRTHGHDGVHLNPNRFQPKRNGSPLFSPRWSHGGSYKGVDMAPTTKMPEERNRNHIADDNDTNRRR
jgi:hypothetical protein